MFADASSLPWARYFSVPVLLMDHSWSCEFSPHTNTLRPVELQYCTGVECKWRVLPQGMKSRVVTSCGHGSTGPGEAVIHTGGAASFLQFVFISAKSAGLVLPR